MNASIKGVMNFSLLEGDRSKSYNNCAWDERLNAKKTPDKLFNYGA